MKPKLLDLFCGAGGAGVGYHRAGFDVVGVDIEPMRDYPFPFVQADAIEYVRAHGHEFDAIHASPPCQHYTTMSNRWRGAGGVADLHPDMIGPTRELLRASGRLWVIENVSGAARKMASCVKLTGGMFGLGVNRPRLFESNVLILTPHDRGTLNPVGVYGKLDGRRLWSRADGTEQRAARGVAEAGDVMGIDWMTSPRAIAEAIPPAYTEYIGGVLIAALVAAPYPGIQFP